MATTRNRGDDHDEVDSPTVRHRHAEAYQLPQRPANVLQDVPSYTPTFTTWNSRTALSLMLLTKIPQDCLSIVCEFLPYYIQERCHMCGTPVVMSDHRGRLHFGAHIVCSDTVIVCAECFDVFFS